MSDLPRLLLCSFDVLPSPSGASRRLTEYLKALPDRFSVVVLSVKTPDHTHIEKYEGARLLRVPVGSGDLASRIQSFERAVRRQLESEEYALVHFTDPFGGYALCELKGDYGYRLVYEAESFPSQELRYTHPQLEGDRKFLSKVRRQELFCLMNADRIITGSSVTQGFIQSLGVQSEAVSVVRAPVDLGSYAPEALGMPDGQPMRLMYLGSQVSWQGLAGLLRGLALAVKDVDVRLTLVGARHPDWQPHLEDLTAELGLKQHVEFQPPVSHGDVAKVLTLADVGVVPLDDVDRNRIQGGALAKLSEYLAAGRPVLAADLPVTRELLPSSAGLFYPPGDTRALADRIIELARDVPRRLALGKQARAYAEQRLDAGRIRGQLLDLYDGLLGKRPMPTEPAAEPEPEHTRTGTPTNRVLGLVGTVSAGKQDAPDTPAAPPSKVRRPESEPMPDTDPGQSPPGSEEPPLVVGHVLVEDGADSRFAKTELEERPDGPPVIMGLPLRDEPPAPRTDKDKVPPARPAPASPPPIPSRPSMMSRSLSPESRPEPAPAPAPAPAPRPPALPPRREERPTVKMEPPVLQPTDKAPARPSIAIPPLPPRSRLSGSRPALPMAPPVLSPVEPRAPGPSPEQEEPEEISSSYAQPLRDEDGAPTPLHASPLEEPEEISSAYAQPLRDEDLATPTPRHTTPLEEPEAISNAEIHATEAPDIDAREPLDSRLNPWFAHLAHGYCPPEGTHFARHTPPTTFPGRDSNPPPTSPPKPPSGTSRVKP